MKLIIFLLITPFVLCSQKTLGNKQVIYIEHKVDRQILQLDSITFVIARVSPSCRCFASSEQLI